MLSSILRIKSWIRYHPCPPGDDNPLERKMQNKSFQVNMESATGMCTKEAQGKYIPTKYWGRISGSSDTELNLENWIAIIWTKFRRLRKARWMNRMDKGTMECPGCFRQFSIAEHKAGNWDCLRKRQRVCRRQVMMVLKCHVGQREPLKAFNLWPYRVRFDITHSFMKDGFSRYTAKNQEKS